MGKKGKKKGSGENDEEGSSQPQQQQPPQQQQRQQQQPPQQPQQQQPQRQQQPPQQQRQQQQPQQRQQQQQAGQAAAGMAQLNIGAGGDRRPPQQQQHQQGGGRGRGRGGPQERGPIPGMQQAPTRAPGAPWGQRQDQAPTPGPPIPGMPQQGPPPGQQGQQRTQGPGQGQHQQPQGQQRPQGGQPPQGQGQQRPQGGQPQQGQGQQRPQGGQPQQGQGQQRGQSGQGQQKPQQPQPKQSPPGSTPVKTSLTAGQQSMYRDMIPKRKNPNAGGRAGRKIMVETNMVPIQFTKNFPTTITHYDIKLDPDKPKFMYRPVVEAVRLKHYPKCYPAFDGRCNLFAAGTLPFGNSLHTEVEVLNEQRQSSMTFKVNIVKTQEIDMSWLKNVKPGLQENDRELIAIQALDVVMRSAPYRRNAISVGRSFFTQPEGHRAVDLGSGIDLWVGSFQSAVLGWKPYFNIDVAHKGFPRNQPVLNLLQQLCGDPRNPNAELSARDIDYGRRKVQDYLKGLKVTYEIPGHPSSKRTMGINDLGKSSKEATFQLQDGSVTTVQNYFAREKRYKIRYPDLPTLWVGSKNKLILIPAELCIIEAGQVTNKKMDERQTATMIKFAATDAHTRKQKIMDGFAKMRFNDDPAMKEFGISVAGEFEKVQARVIDPPPLSDKRPIMVRKGVWRANSFYKSMVLPPKSWTILNLNDRTQETPLRILVETLTRAGRAVGMEIGEPLTPFKNMRAPLRDVREIVQFFEAMKKENMKLIIVIVPDRTGPVYGKVKQVAELNVGILTQCLKAVTVERKMNDATAGNILLKINSKLNGTNQIFSVGKAPPCLNTPCMIVGADVTHPSPDAIGIPSIAAVAASHSPTAFNYNIKIRLQPPKTEIILHLEEIMREQLLFFYRSTKQKPEKIIFYRDGVSEGQFPQVMHHELQAIRNACSKLSPNSKYEPKITFLVVQKRHHIRLFPTDPRNSDDRNGNVQAGTVVDTDITHPSHIDFYLVSHASIQGTARPTKYRCLWDDSDMCEDEIEQLTYYLCHMFSRCTRSVSYPAPTYYAHLAAFRARALTNEVDIRLNNLEEEQRMKMTIKSEILEGNPMFFV